MGPSHGRISLYWQVGAGTDTMYSLWNPTAQPVDLMATITYGNQGGGEDGEFPEAPVIDDASGSLYGTTDRGGASNFGVVYKVDAGGQETILYSFTGMADGGDPDAGLVIDAAGNLFGTTSSGGHGYGVVFKLEPTGKETTLYSFAGGLEGASPQSGLTIDSAGTFTEQLLREASRTREWFTR